MRLRKPCEAHGLYDAHIFETFSITSSYPAPIENGFCPGGEFLTEDTLVIEKVDGEWPEAVIDDLFGPIYYHFGSEDAPECRDLAVRLLDALTVREGAE